MIYWQLLCLCLGLANIKGICDSARRTAINHEAGEYADIQTAAHELGHKSAFYSVYCCLFIVRYKLTCSTLKKQ